MTKPLLSVEDLKLFIVTSIDEALRTIEPDIVGSKELMRRTGLNQYKFKKYLSLGMPHKMVKGDRKFNINKVLTWLKENQYEIGYMC